MSLPEPDPSFLLQISIIRLPHVLDMDYHDQVSVFMQQRTQAVFTACFCAGSLSSPCVSQYDTVFKATPPADLVWFQYPIYLQKGVAFFVIFELLAPGF